MYNVHVNQYNGEVFPQGFNPNLLKIQLQSRHTTSMFHVLWISYTKIDIVSWYCRCKTGARVFGVCAHYLFNYPLSEDTLHPRPTLDSVCVPSLGCAFISSRRLTESRKTAVNDKDVLFAHSVLDILHIYLNIWVRIAASLFLPSARYGPTAVRK